MMLSRIAESMFWIGRYVERAEDTARILDVATQRLLEDPSLDHEAECRGVLSVMGVEGVEGPVDQTRLLDLLAYDPQTPASMAHSISSARESARGARETLAVPLWEAINTAYLAIPSKRFGAMRPPRIFGWVVDRAALINGTADATMTHDESWQFMVLGRSVERIDMTSRMVATAALGSGDAWSSTLRACGAYEAFLRTYRGVETERAAAEFLLLDRLFPRSAVFALNRAEQCLENLEASGTRTGFRNEAHRLIGRTRAELEYRNLAEIVANLPDEMERLQQTCASATDAVTKRYFAGAEATMWQGVI